MENTSRVAMPLSHARTIWLRVGPTHVRPTLRRILDLYTRYETPKKTDAGRKGDYRRAALFTRVFGADRDLRHLTRRDWDGFIELRSNGTINARGHSVDEAARRPVRDGTVRADLVFLRTLIHWAMRWEDRRGLYLLREDPTRGCVLPRELSPRRPIVTTERYERVLAVASGVPMRVTWEGRPCSIASHLRPVLVLAYNTGRRISAILSLCHDDLHLDRRPHPAIRWPARTDKMNRESVVPICPEVRDVLEPLVPGQRSHGAAPVFPAPTDPTRPVSVMVASRWLRKAEILAGVEKQDGSLWHAYRRGWATSRKHLPDVDVAAAGGWTDISVLKAVYQLPDEDGMYRAACGGRRIREG